MKSDFTKILLFILALFLSTGVVLSEDSCSTSIPNISLKWSDISRDSSQILSVSGTNASGLLDSKLFKNKKGKDSTQYTKICTDLLTSTKKLTWSQVPIQLTLNSMGELNGTTDVGSVESVCDNVFLVCTSSCKDCNSLLPPQAVGNIAGFAIDALSKCATKCPAGKFISGSQCISCKSGFSKGGSSTTCTECPEGWMPTMDHASCEPVSSPPPPPTTTTTRPTPTTTTPPTTTTTTRPPPTTTRPTTTIQTFPP